MLSIAYGKFLLPFFVSDINPMDQCLAKRAANVSRLRPSLRISGSQGSMFIEFNSGFLITVTRSCPKPPMLKKRSDRNVS